MATKFHPYITASALASFIGKHPYQPQEKTFYDILNKDEMYSRKIRKLLSEERREPVQAAVKKVLHDPIVHELVRSSVARCVASTETTRIVEETKETAIIAVAKAFPAMTSTIQKQMVDEIIGTVQKNQGTQQEPQIIQTYEAETNTTVTQKNEQIYRKNIGPYVLGGKTDGFVSESRRVLEVKSRMSNAVRPPPSYDIIQLRVYMELTGALEGELRERYPGIPPRSTIYPRDTNEWNILHNDILVATDKLCSIADNDEELKRIVVQNSLSM